MYFFEDAVCDVSAVSHVCLLIVEVLGTCVIFSVTHYHVFQIFEALSYFGIVQDGNTVGQGSVIVRAGRAGGAVGTVSSASLHLLSGGHKTHFHL